MLAKAKAVTTKWKYSDRIIKAVDSLPEEYMCLIDLISIETTLVTNVDIPVLSCHFLRFFRNLDKPLQTTSSITCTLSPDSANSGEKSVPKKRTSLKKIREIIRLEEQAGLSHRRISQTTGVSRPVVARTLNSVSRSGGKKRRFPCI